MVDAGRESFVFWFFRTQENAFLDAFSKNFVFVPQIFFVQQKVEGRPPPPSFARALMRSKLNLKEEILYYVKANCLP